MKTEIILFKQQIAENPKFTDQSDYGWKYTGDVGIDWTKNPNSILKIPGTARSLYQDEKLSVGVNYKVKFNVSSRTAGTINFKTHSSGAVHLAVSSNNLNEVVFRSDGIDIILETNNTFDGIISNFSISQDPADISLDLTEDVSIPFNFSIDDLRYPEKRTTNYSKTVVLPSTGKNNSALSHIYEISSEGLFNPNKQSRVIIKNSGITVFDGIMCLDEVLMGQTSNGRYGPKAYNVSFVGTVKNIFSVWGNKSVNELDFSEYNHKYNYNFISNSWKGSVVKNGSWINNTSQSYTSPAITGMNMVVHNNIERVQITFASAHSFADGQSVFGDTSNNLLSGMQTVVDVSTNSITLNLIWSSLSDLTTPTGVFTDFRFEGYGYIYPMIDMATMNKSDKEDQFITNGSLIPGINYIIIEYVPGDNFSISGSPIDNPGTAFTANDTPPVWTNGSILAPTDVANWRVNEFYPGVFVKEIIDKAFKLAGYQYNSPLFDTNMFKRLIVPYSKGADFNMKKSDQDNLVFRASMQDTLSEPTGHTFEDAYTLYPFPNTSPYNLAAGTYFPVNINYSALFPANTYVVASHHRMAQNAGGAATKSGKVPFNNDTPPTDFDLGNNYSTTLFEYTQPSGYPSLEYTFSFSGQCWNYIKNFYAFNGTDGDLPSDYAGTGAPGIYANAGNNGKYFGAITAPPPTSFPVYNERTDVTFNPYNVIVFQKSNDGGSTWTTIKALSTAGPSASYSVYRWENTLVKGDCDVFLNAGDKVRVIYAATAKFTALRSDGHPCYGASSGGAAGTGPASGGTGGPVKFTIRVENAIFSNKIKNPVIQEDLAFDMNTVLPDVKISDFFVSIIRMFNLLIDYNGEDNTLMIEPRNTYYDTAGSKLDWTDRLNIASEISEKFMSKLNSKTYIFSYKEGNDFYNKDYKTDWGGFDNRIYGDKIVNTENDFTNNTNETNLVFAPTPMVGPDVIYRGADRVISAIYSRENDTDVKKIKSLNILFYNVRGTDVPWNVVSLLGYRYMDMKWISNKFRFYPQAIHMDNHLTPQYDLNFGQPLAYYYDFTAITTRTLYDVYHKRFIENITSRYSKLITVELRLSVIDISTLNFRKLIVIDGHQLYLNKIIDWNINGSGLCKCEFLKV